MMAITKCGCLHSSPPPKSKDIIPQCPGCAGRDMHGMILVKAVLSTEPSKLECSMPQYHMRLYRTRYAKWKATWQLICEGHARDTGHIV